MYRCPAGAEKRYEAELEDAPGTWFLSPGWTHMGTDFVFHELQLHDLVPKLGPKGIDPLQLARRMLDGFTRALYIDMGIEDRAVDLPVKAARIAEDLGLKLESTRGSYGMLRSLLDRALDITARKTGS